MTRAIAGGEPPCQRRFCGRTRTRRARSGSLVSAVTRTPWLSLRAGRGHRFPPSNSTTLSNGPSVQRRPCHPGCQHAAAWTLV